MADSPLMSQLWQMMLSLALVVMLILLMAWLGKKIFHGSSSVGALQLLAGVSLGRRERVVLLQVGSKQLVLGVTQHRIDLLHVLEETIVKNDTEGVSPLFRQLMDTMTPDKSTKSVDRP